MSNNNNNSRGKSSRRKHGNKQNTPANEGVWGSNANNSRKQNVADYLGITPRRLYLTEVGLIILIIILLMKVLR